MSTLRCTNLQDTSGGNSLTTAQIYNGAAKAWVNFNGSGVVAIRGNFNVSSITDNASGDYTVNFTNALADANYSVVGTTNRSNNEVSNTGYGASVSIRGASAPTTTAVRIYTIDIGAASTAAYIIAVSDPAYINVAIFR